jgi:hypothetical protein
MGGSRTYINMKLENLNPPTTEVVKVQEKSSTDTLGKKHYVNFSRANAATHSKTSKILSNTSDSNFNNPNNSYLRPINKKAIKTGLLSEH